MQRFCKRDVTQIVLAQDESVDKPLICRDLSADAAQLLHARSVLVYACGTQHFHE